MSYRYFISLAYNGARYHGWQIQQNAVTVQEMITDAIRTMWSMMDFKMIGCGRTDTGVNASQFFAHFDLEIEKNREELDDLAFRLNRFLPDDIVILSIFPVAPDLHSRFDPVSRTYEYYIHTRKDPFLTNFSWYVHQQLDIDLMNQAGEILKEYEDFTSFSKANIKRKTNLCTIYDAHWEKDGHRLTFHITANRFLHDMVRAIVGTMMRVGMHKISLEEFRTVIESRNRCNAGESVPARGLFLTRVEYPGLKGQDRK